MPEVRRGSAHGVSDPALVRSSGSWGPRQPLQQHKSADHAPAVRPRSAGNEHPKTEANQDLLSKHNQNDEAKIQASREDKDTHTDTNGSNEAVAKSPKTETPQRSDSGNIVVRKGSRPGSHRLSYDPDHPDSARRSLSYALRRPAEVYYDSRAGTHREWKRRGKTLQEYYDHNPQLLPQLPFTWHHGKKRWRLFFFAFLVFVDASAVPIALYYGMRYAGHVPGWIIFAVITTIWGGPTYLEFAVRTLRLIKKERFYRPLGTDSRWCFDMLTWASVLTIGVVTALFIIGSAPHIVWLRVLCMPAPSILWCLGGVLAIIQLYHVMHWPAPCRISSTPKGGKVLPGAYYFIEDVAAVNAGAGRPFREALAARYQASPRFQRMLNVQSLFWSVPALILAAALTVVAVIPPVPATGAYGVCWAVPFLWCALWGAITVKWCKKEMVRERLEWEAGTGPAKLPSPSSRSEGSNV